MAFFSHLLGTGKIVYLRTPLDGLSPADMVEDGVRVDSGVVSGSEVSTFYDPMIAKLIAYGANRDEALYKLERALRKYQVPSSTSSAFFQFKCIFCYYLKLLPLLFFFFIILLSSSYSFFSFLLLHL